LGEKRTVAETLLLSNHRGGGEKRDSGKKGGGGLSRVRFKSETPYVFENGGPWEAVMQKRKG